MFGTFLLFIIYVVTSLGLLISLGLSVFFFLKAKQELTRPREIVELLANPTLFLSPDEFSEKGEPFRLRFLQASGLCIGLIILFLLLKLVLA